MNHQFDSDIDAHQFRNLYAYNPCGRNRYLILGATGTLGQAMIKALGPDADILAVSRDELKLSELKKKFPHIKTAIGDIRDRSSIRPHFRGIDVVFHFAALKRVPELEAQPVESLKTNVLGTINAAELAIAAKVKHFVFSSTDKAVRPINAYGASKFLSEKILLSMQGRGTNFSVYRWGNVLASRGSAIYAFKDAIENDRPAEITHAQMGRFWIKIEDAAKFVLDTYEEELNSVKIPKMKAATVLRMLGAIGHVSGKPSKYKIVGMRPGEKIQEDILYDSESGKCLSSENVEQFSSAELLEIAKCICT